MKNRHGQEDADEDAAMTEAEWLECTDTKAMLKFLRGRSSQRKLRLFAAACCRQIWRLFKAEKCRQAVGIG